MGVDSVEAISPDRWAEIVDGLAAGQRLLDKKKKEIEVAYRLIRGFISENEIRSKDVDGRIQAGSVTWYVYTSQQNYNYFQDRFRQLTIRCEVNGKDVKPEHPPAESVVAIHNSLRSFIFLVDQYFDIRKEMGPYLDAVGIKLLDPKKKNA